MAKGYLSVAVKKAGHPKSVWKDPKSHQLPLK